MIDYLSMYAYISIIRFGGEPFVLCIRSLMNRDVVRENTNN